MSDEKKMIYVNLWYDMYYEKTNAQLKSFRKLGYETHIMTVEDDGATFICKVMKLSEGNHLDEITYFSVKKSYSVGYFALFKRSFEFVINENYEFIYIRRLMSKIAFAAPYIKKLSKSVPIVYEIPTYPLDKTYNSLLFIRNTIEFSLFRFVSRHFSIITTVLSDKVQLPGKWMTILNGIDIDRYPMPEKVPELQDTINILAVSNMAKSHCYERLLYAIKNYHGKYRIHLTIISSDTDTYKEFKSLAKKLELEKIIQFLPAKTIDEVSAISHDCHIGIGILTYGEKRRTIDTSLKNKDYCALGIPFISTCPDASFPAPFEYHYIVNNESYDIDLEPIFDWYVNIREDAEYKEKMYNYAKEKLQYDGTAAKIISELP